MASTRELDQVAAAQVPAELRPYCQETDSKH